MITNTIVQLGLFFLVLLLAVRPLGWFMARVLEGPDGHAPLGLGRLLGWLERLLYRLCGINPAASMHWKSYATVILLFNAIGFAALYLLQRWQHILPANPAGLGPVEAGSAFNTAVSFVSNTNWQGYAGEVTMSYLTQMLGLGVQNFLSAATGIAVLAALIRGISLKSSHTIGNCWADLTRITLYILLPLSFVLAITLASQGVVQSFKPPQTVTLTQPLDGGAGQAAISTQVLPMGPAASQVAIKQLGTNGGGFFNANSAHPFENPNALTNFLSLISIVLIPAALCLTFGEMVRDRRQGWALLAAMLMIFTPMLISTCAFEQSGNPQLSSLVDDAASGQQSGGNMEGKEARFGIVNSAAWAAATTAASNGSVNAMHDSFTPLGGLVAMWLIQLGEVVFGGVGSGLYGMLMFTIVAVFVAGLMVGRTPEYLGKKIEPFEMKMASLVLLIPCAIALLGTAVAVVVPEGATTSNPGPHGFSQILYAFSSAANNNGSAFAGLNANTPFYNIALGVAMWFGRFWVIVPVLAVAGSLASKKAVPVSAGTLATHNAVFVLMLVAVVIVVGALTFVPALALGPIAEHLQLSAR